jgi:hypothetical protein
MYLEITSSYKIRKYIEGKGSRKKKFNVEGLMTLPLIK